MDTDSHDHTQQSTPALKCLVTGASSGIGKAICQVLNRDSPQHKVVGVGRNETALRQLCEQGVLVDYIVADITVAGECQRIVEQAAEKLGGRLTTVINAAGILRGGAIGDDDTTDLANYEANMKCNTQAPFEIIIHAVPYLRKEMESFPSIINISSVNGKQSFAGCAAYCSKYKSLSMLEITNKITHSFFASLVTFPSL